MIETGPVRRGNSRVAAQNRGSNAEDGGLGIDRRSRAGTPRRFSYPVWEETKGNDGYVSFELDPLLEDPACKLSVEEKADRYVELGKKWSAGHRNRMIKVPATPGGLAALEPLCAAGVTLNVTLIFSMRQYKAARDAVWRGAQKRAVARALQERLQHLRLAGRRVHREARARACRPPPRARWASSARSGSGRRTSKFWADKGTPLQQEMIFASTGTKKPSDPPWKYVEALAGSDIQTNPPATNEAVEKSGRTFRRMVDQMPPAEVLAEIDAKVESGKARSPTHARRRGEVRRALQSAAQCCWAKSGRRIRPPGADFGDL